MKIKWQLFILLFFCFFSGCVQKEMQIGDQRVIEQSQKKQPAWITETIIHTKDNIYITGYSNNPTQPFRFTKKNLEQNISTFFNDHVDPYLLPVKESFGNSTKNRIKKSIVDYIYKRLAVPALKNKQIYWEKIETLTENGPVITTHYYMIVQINRSLFYQNEHNGMYFEYRKAMVKNKSLLEKRLKKSIEIQKDKATEEKMSMQTLTKEPKAFKKTKKTR